MTIPGKWRVLITTLLASCAFCTAQPSPTTAPSATQPTPDVYRNRHFGFTLEIPPSCTATETEFYHSHYTHVFLAINSKRAGLTVQNQRTSPQSEEFNSRTILQQMRPGEVYVAFALSEGPGPTDMVADSVNQDIHALLAASTVSRSSEPGWSILELYFFKRGHRWNISVYLSDPIAPEDRRKVESMLQSLQFVESPVSNVGWAESLAWAQLPAGMRMSNRWMTTTLLGAQAGNDEEWVQVDKSASGYTVTFKPVGQVPRKYSVSQDAKVAPLAP